MLHNLLPLKPSLAIRQLVRSESKWFFTAMSTVISWLDLIDLALELDDLNLQVLYFWFVPFEILFKMSVLLSFYFEVFFKDEYFWGLFGLFFKSKKFLVHLISLFDDFTELSLEDIKIIKIARNNAFLNILDLFWILLGYGRNSYRHFLYNLLNNNLIFGIVKCIVKVMNR